MSGITSMIKMELNQRSIDYVMDQMVLSLGDFVNIIALKTWTSLVYKTPVGNPYLWTNKAPKGYVGGKARFSWNIQAKSPDKSIPDTWSTSIPITPNFKNTGYDPVYVTSSIPYMNRLEKGWSSQGSHMQERTLSEITFEFNSIG